MCLRYALYTLELLGIITGIIIRQGLGNYWAPYNTRLAIDGSSSGEKLAEPCKYAISGAPQLRRSQTFRTLQYINHEDLRAHSGA